MADHVDLCVRSIPGAASAARANGASGEIFADIEISLSRVVIGFVTGTAAALVLGLFMGRIRILHDLLDPLVEFMRFLSPTAMISIVVIWFGIGEMAKYALVFWGTAFIVLINTIAGVMYADYTSARGTVPGRLGSTNFPPDRAA